MFSAPLTTLMYSILSPTCGKHQHNPAQPTACCQLSANRHSTMHSTDSCKGFPVLLADQQPVFLLETELKKIPFGSLLLQRPHPRQQAFIPPACWLLHTYLHQPQVVLALHRIPKHRVAPVQQVGPAGGELTLLQQEKDLAAGTVGRKKSRCKGTGSS